VDKQLNLYPINNFSTFQISFERSFFDFLYYHFMIQFKHKYQTDDGKDGGYIEISYDGLNWTNIIKDTLISIYSDPPNLYNFYNETDTIVNGESAFTGQSDGWITSEFDWAWGAWDYEWMTGNEITPVIRFVFKSDSIDVSLQPNLDRLV